jgi:fused signal recognition particle receptor
LIIFLHDHKEKKEEAAKRKRILEEAQKQDEAQLRKKSRPVNRQRKVAKKPIQQELVAAEAEVEAEAQAEAEAEAEAEEQDKEDVQEVEVQVPSQKVSKKPKKQVVQKRRYSKRLQKKK